MIYLLILALFTIIIILTRKQLGLAIILALAMSVFANLIAVDIATLLVNSGLAIPKCQLVSWLYIALILIPVGVIIFRSHKRSRSIIRIILESTLLLALILVITGHNVFEIIKLDQLSNSIYQVLSNNSKFIIIISGFYGFWQMIIKDEE